MILLLKLVRQFTHVHVYRPSLLFVSQETVIPWVKLVTLKVATLILPIISIIEIITMHLMCMLGK